MSTALRIRTFHLHSLPAAGELRPRGFGPLGEGNGKSETRLKRRGFHTCAASPSWGLGFQKVREVREGRHGSQTLVTLAEFFVCLDPRERAPRDSSISIQEKELSGT